MQDTASLRRQTFRRNAGPSGLDPRFRVKKQKEKEASLFSTPHLEGTTHTGRPLLGMTCG